MKTVKHRVLWTEPISKSSAAADLSWTDTDPLAVTLTFHYPGEDRKWLFSLDLITTITSGLALVAGLHDVQTGYERREDGFRWFNLILSSPDGAIKIQAPMNDVANFAQAVEHLLPAEGILETMMDFELAELLKKEEGI